SDPTPEEKLLRAIFGDKAGDVKDASLKASPSLSGVVLDKKLFARAVKDKRKRSKDKEDIALLETQFEVKFNELKDILVDKLFTKGKKFTQKMLYAIEDFSHLTKGQWTTDEHTNKLIADLIHNYKIKLNDLQGVLRREKFMISVGDELPSGILKLAKVYIAKKRKL